MKRTLLVLSLTLLMIQVLPQANSVTIEGRVLRKSTSEALSDVLVLLGGSGEASTPPASSANLATQIQILRSRLRIQSPGGLVEESVRDILRATGSSISSANFALTDSGGRFTFKDLPPGTYTLRVAREGFFGPKINGGYQPYFSKTLELQPSTPSVWVEAGLAQGAIVMGRVLGRALPNARPTVTAYRLTYMNGTERWDPEFVVNADTAGAFQMRWVAPGEFYLGSSGTFFRDATDPALATKLVAREGETMTVEFAIQQTLNPARRVSGSAINPYATPNPLGGTDFSVSDFLVVPLNPNVADPLYTKFSNALSAGGLRGGNRANGEFEIGPVPPGSYELISYIVEPTTRRTLIGRAPFQLSGSNVNGLSASIQPGVTFSGEVRTNGVLGGAINLATLSVMLESLGPLPTGLVAGTNPITVDVAGRFSAFNVPEEKYRAHVGGLPATAYVADIRQGNRSVFDEGFRLAAGVGDIQVLIEPQGQTVTGTVRSADGIPSETASVVLVPPEAERRNPMRYRIASTDANGQFTMQNVPPGQYTVFAWENILPTAWMNTKVLQKHERRGRTINVSSGVPIDLQLVAIPDN